MSKDYIKIFYVVYAKEEKLDSCLNAIRLLCDPEQRNPAHLTIRGPYSKRAKSRDLEKWNKELQSNLVFVKGGGTFFNESQNTVFLLCEASSINQVWYKPDYRDGIPHITLYDGKSREFAEKLSKVLEKYEPQINFKVTKLEPLRTRQGSITSKIFNEPEFVKDVLEEDIDFSAIQNLTVEKRLQLIEKLFAKLFLPQSEKLLD